MSKYARPKKQHPVLIVLLVLVLLAILGVALGLHWLNGEVGGTNRSVSDTITVEIPKGASTAEIANILVENKVIGNAFVFRAYCKYTAGSIGDFQYGTFSVSPMEGYAGVIKTLQTTTAHEDTVTVTFPEGYNAYQMGDVLEKAGLCTKDEFIKALNTNTGFGFGFESEISADPLKLVRYDGFLFPDTYQFFPDATVEDIIKTMLKNFEAKAITPAYTTLREKQGYSLEDWVIFASIIQKEAANVEEMYNVSAVFYNRMKPNSGYPQLESCTTNNYIADYMQPAFAGKAPQNMLDAYDTYGKNGFPVGAIASPGLDALDAALKPNDTPYYFFVTDIEFTHYYGKTYQEHLTNIEKAKAVNKTHGKIGL